MQVTDSDLIRLREQNKASPGNELHKYIKKDGRASVTIIPTETGYDIRADCDSLQKLVFEYERAINTMWEQNSKLSEKVRDGPTIWDLLKVFSMGVLTGIILIVILKIK